MHAREMVFVLDVSEDDNARLQGYAYHEMTHDDGTTVETGTVEALPTELGSHLLKDLVRAGTLPVVMILRYRSTGNHYQAITYDQARFTEYCKRWEELAGSRSDVLKQYGGSSLDPHPFDVQKTTQAAAQELKRIRKAAKLSRRTLQSQIGREERDTAGENRQSSDMQVQKMTTEEGMHAETLVQKELKGNASSTTTLNEVATKEEVYKTVQQSLQTATSQRTTEQRVLTHRAHYPPDPSIKPKVKGASSQYTEREEQYNTEDGAERHIASPKPNRSHDRKH